MNDTSRYWSEFVSIVRQYNIWRDVGGGPHLVLHDMMTVLWQDCWKPFESACPDKPWRQTVCAFEWFGRSFLGLFFACDVLSIKKRHHSASPVEIGTQTSLDQRSSKMKRSDVRLDISAKLTMFILFLHSSFVCRKENNNVFVDDLKEDGEKRSVPNPCSTFLEAFEAFPEIMENIERVGFVRPTPIQVCTPRQFYFVIYLYTDPSVICSVAQWPAAAHGWNTDVSVHAGDVWQRICKQKAEVTFVNTNKSKFIWKSLRTCYHLIVWPWRTVWDTPAVKFSFDTPVICVWSPRDLYLQSLP